MSARREMDPVVADAEIARLEAQFQHADDHLKRLEPLLPQQFVTTDRVEEARTQRASALAALNEARARKQAAVAALVSTRAQHVATEAALQQARSERVRAEDAIGQNEGINARIAAAEAAVHAAELDLSYCRVRAPFTGLVVNMNISNGAFARAGVEVFTLVDTRTWYVVANFRETQLRHIPAGAPVDLYLQSQPSKHFRGTVVGLGWAVLPENGTSVNGLPRVERSLDWIRLAARFPVRIKVENPDDSFRIGASAVATVRGTCALPANESLSPPRLSAPRARADAREGQRHLPSHPGLPGSHNPHLDPPDSRGAACHVRHVPDHAGRHGRHAHRIDPGRCRRLTIGLGLALLAWEISLDIPWLRLCFLVAIPLRGSLPQTRSHDRRGRLRHRSSGSSVMILPDILPPTRKCWSSSSSGSGGA